MGSSNQKCISESSHNWVKSPDSKCFYCTIHKECKTNDTFTADNKDLLWNTEMYNRRVAPSKYIARVFSYWIEGECRCSSKSVFHLETEFYTLLENITTNHSETVYLLLSLLYGYGELFKVVKKYFLIDFDMIGVTNQGEVRVWINPDFSSNEFMYLQDHPLAEKRLVERIFELVIQNSQKYALPLSFTRFRNQNLDDKSFLEAIVKIKKFARLNNLRIPTCIESSKKPQSPLIRPFKSSSRLESMSGVLTRLVARPIDHDPQWDGRYDTSNQKMLTRIKDNSSILSLDSMIHYSGKTTGSDNVIACDTHRMSKDQSVKIYEPLQQQAEMITFKNLFEYSPVH